MRRAACLLLTLLLGAALPPSAPGAPPPSKYAPVPPGIQALVGTTAEEELATRAIVAIFDPDPSAAAQAGRDLLLAGNAGLRRAVERLAACEPCSDRALLELLGVIIGSKRAEVDGVLAIAAGESRPEARALAAFGLGAGRTGAAVEALVRLAQDKVVLVRAAALRALFAIESPSAIDARRRLPLDEDPQALTLRLRLHRLRGDDGPAVLGTAALAYVTGRTAAVRIEATRLMAALGPAAPKLALEAAIVELAGDPRWAQVIRRGLRAPPRGYDPATRRLAAAEALCALALRPDLDAATKQVLVDVGVDWIAHPLHQRGHQIDYEARTRLFAMLPEVGEKLAEPVRRRLVAHAFDDPMHGMTLLTSLDAAIERATLRSLVLAQPPVARAILTRAGSAYRNAGRIGDLDVARVLLDPAQASDVRLDAIHALEGDDSAWALPLLEKALFDADDGVAGGAADALLLRAEPVARMALESSLLTKPWRPFEQAVLHAFCVKPDDATYVLLEKMLRKGSPVLREAVMAEFRDPRRSMSGPRARALVQMAIDEPKIGWDVGEIATALCSVDEPAAVRWVREHAGTWRSRDVLIYNLHVVSDRAALDFALEYAAGLRDDDPLLQVVAQVLAGPCGKDVARTDPFWRRCLTKGPPVLRRLALAKLTEVKHGPLSAVLVPILADPKMSVDARVDALKACTGEPHQPSDALLWTLASDRNEEDDLRTEAAKRLAQRARPVYRAKALAWLGEKVDEPSETVNLIGEIAGRGATEAEAADLLQLLRDDLSVRYRERPYYRTSSDEQDRALATRATALIRALGAAKDSASLDALAEHLFDPRFATYSSEAKRHEAFVRGQAGGILSPFIDPPDEGVLLHKASENPNVTPAAPIPAEASEIVDALWRQGPKDVAARLERAVDAAAASGRLAQFTDLYVVWLMDRLGQGSVSSEEPASPPALPVDSGDAAAAALERALEGMAPVAGPEEFHVAKRRSDRSLREGRYAEAAAFALEAARLSARTGMGDTPPSRSFDRGRPNPPETWQVLRARVDFLEGMAAASVGKTEEARDAFRRGLARAPFDVSLVRFSAFAKATVGLDLASAEADALRALDLERRMPDGPSRDSRSLLAWVRARLSAPATPNVR